MKKIIDIFRIRREERWVAIIALFVIVVLNSLVIYKYSGAFLHNTGSNYWQIFVRTFHISGYDPITYSVVTDWTIKYNVFRHPLLAFMIYPLYLINTCFIHITGLNIVQFLVCIILIFSAFYSFIFIRRIFRDIIKLGSFDSTLLSALFFSFAYIIVAMTVPDHFVMSMSLILFTLYISGMKMCHHTRFKMWQTIILFLLTAGITLSNGIKVFIAALFTDGKKFFRPINLLMVVIIPSCILWMLCGYEYRTYILPGERARNIAHVKQVKHERDSIYKMVVDTANTTDSIVLNADVKAVMKQHARDVYRATRNEPWRQKGKPIRRSGFMSWTDVTTPRIPTVIENLFGESIQLHKTNLLQDILYMHRPIIVKYNWIISYVVEASLFLLFIVGIWVGRRSRFLWMCLSCVAFDMLIHLGLGFGINEVYIMGPHWLFIIPIAISFLLRSSKESLHKMLRFFIIILTCYLWIYNLWLYTGYLIG